MASKEKIEALKNNPKALKGMTQSEALIMRQLLDVEDMADELKGFLKDIDLRDVKYVKGGKGDTGERGEIGPRGETGPVGPRGESGNDGHTPTRAEIEAIIIPLIEKPEKIDTTALVNKVLAQVLTMNAGATAPEWATPSGGAGWSLIESKSLSTGTSALFNTGLSGYKLFRVEYIAQNASTCDLRLRLNGDTGSNYNYQKLDVDGSSESPGRSTSQTAIYIAAQYANTPTSVQIDICQAAAGYRKTIRSTSSQGDGTSTNYRTTAGYWNNTTSVISSIDVYMSAGSFVFGEVRLLGLA